MVKICFFLRERIHFGLLVCNTKQFSNPNNLFMTGSYTSVQWCTENNESSLPYELTAFLTAACHIENICLMAAGKREQRTCSHKVADRRGHLQGLLVVVPVISMLRPVLSCSNYHWHRLLWSYDWGCSNCPLLDGNSHCDGVMWNLATDAQGNHWNTFFHEMAMGAAAIKYNVKKNIYLAR